VKFIWIFLYCFEREILVCFCTKHLCLISYVFFSVVVLEESPRPRGSLRTNLHILVLGPQLLVFVLPCTTKSSEIFKDSPFCKQSVTGMYDHVKYHHHVWHISVNKPFFTVSQCCCHRGKTLSSRTNLQDLVLVLETSPCPQTLSSWQQHWRILCSQCSICEFYCMCTYSYTLWVIKYCTLFDSSIIFARF